MDTIKWTKVYELFNYEQAEVLRTFLESNGIKVFLKGEGADELFPGLDVTPVDVMVPQEQAEEAAKLSRQFFEDDEEEE